MVAEVIAGSRTQGLSEPQFWVACREKRGLDAATPTVGQEFGGSDTGGLHGSGGRAYTVQMTTTSNQVDWPGIRQAAALLGIRAAARQSGAHLSGPDLVRWTNRVMQRAHREGWEKAKRDSLVAVSGSVSRMSARTSAPQGLLQGPAVVSAAVMAGNVSATGLLTMHERRDRLAKIVRTPVGEVDEHSPLAQRVKRDKDGNVIEIAMPDKLRALEMDAQFAGELVQKTESDVRGVILQVTPENRAEILKAVKAWEREQGIEQ